MRVYYYKIKKVLTNPNLFSDKTKKTSAKMTEVPNTL